MKQPEFSKSRQIGNLGEDFAVKFLEKHGFSIRERNYLRKWGEIDVIAQKGKKLHFVEVKSIQVGSADVIRETVGIRPEENMHPAKIARNHRAIETYILEQGLDDREWQLDLITVRLETGGKRAKIEYLANIVL